jgi:hypothetical protein
VAALLDHRAHILARANAVHPNMAARGAGARDIEVRRFDAPWPMLVLHLLIDCADAMGANAINAMAEGVAPLVESLTGRTGLPAYSEQPGRPPLRPGDVPCARLIARHGRTSTAARWRRASRQAWKFADVCPTVPPPTTRA